MAYDLEQGHHPLGNTNGILLSLRQPLRRIGLSKKFANPPNPTASHIHGFHRVLRLDLPPENLRQLGVEALRQRAWTEQEYGGNIVNTGRELANQHVERNFPPE